MQTDPLLANLTIDPRVFASILHELSMANFVSLQGSIQLGAGAQPTTVDIKNPPQQLTLVIYTEVQVSSPIIEFQIVKDNVIGFDRSGFNTLNEILPNMYTPVRNIGAIKITNLSNLSTPSISYYLETLQIRRTIWENFRKAMEDTLLADIGDRTRRVT